MTDDEVLRKAREFLVRGWCQGARARNANGEAVDPLHKSAVAWCIMGALDVALGKTQGPRDSDHLLLLLKDASGLDHSRPMSFYNDRKGTTLEWVLGLYDRALAKMVPSPI